MYTPNSPIGIFDSGIGGMTVASAIKKILPNEQLIYFGDTAHLPYGDKSKESIQKYAHAITEFLLKKGVKMIVIACNTASALAFDITKKTVGESIPVINVIDPVVDLVVKNFKKGKIGVIGTKATVNSTIYTQKIKSKLPDSKIEEVATPLLAPMIEEGFFNNNISQTIINNYLSHKRLKNVKQLIPGCTHYPLILNQIASFYDKPIDIIDTAMCVAEKIKETLTNTHFLSTINHPEHHFYVSDYTEGFEQSTRIFFGSKIKLEQVLLWDAL